MKNVTIRIEFSLNHDNVGSLWSKKRIFFFYTVCTQKYVLGRSEPATSILCVAHTYFPKRHVSQIEVLGSVLIAANFVSTKFRYRI